MRRSGLRKRISAKALASPMNISAATYLAGLEFRNEHGLVTDCSFRDIPQLSWHHSASGVGKGQFPILASSIQKSRQHKSFLILFRCFVYPLILLSVLEFVIRSTAALYALVHRQKYEADIIGRHHACHVEIGRIF